MLPILSNVMVEVQGDRINLTQLGIRSSPSSFLMLILMLWSIPVLIYAILFFPGLEQPVQGRRGVHTSRQDEGDNTSNELLFQYLLPTIPAATIALMLGLLVGLSWPVCLMLMGAVAVLIGGIAFTILKMHSLGLPNAKLPLIPSGIRRHNHRRFRFS